MSISAILKCNNLVVIYEHMKSSYLLRLSVDLIYIAVSSIALAFYLSDIRDTKFIPLSHVQNHVPKHNNKNI